MVKEHRKMYIFMSMNTWTVLYMNTYYKLYKSKELHRKMLCPVCYRVWFIRKMRVELSWHSLFNNGNVVIDRWHILQCQFEKDIWILHREKRFGGFRFIWLMKLLQSSMWRTVSSNRRKWSKISSHRAKQ